MNRNPIAVLITCHNRKLKTLACLAALFNQTALSQTKFDVYLVDDGSTDGTADAIQQNYPEVKIFQGDGSLFWNRGMARAFSEALPYQHDYYLWLNDDTILYPEALSILLATVDLAQQGDQKPIVVGSTCDPQTGELTYGGMVRNSWWHPLKFRIEAPSDKPKPCDTMNGNCVLIPGSVVKVVGSLDPIFIHSIGDIDYGLRARQKGDSIWIAPGYLGTCDANPSLGSTWEDPNLTLKERIKKVSGPKGLPFQEWKVFAHRHAGWLWPLYWLLPYLRLLLVSAIGNKKANAL